TRSRQTRVLPPPAMIFPAPASWRLPAAEPRLLLGGHVSERGMVAQLQSTNIGDDGPAIARAHAVAMGIHRAVAVRDHVVEMLIVGRAQSLVMQALRSRHAALDHDAVASADAVMAWCAEHVVLLAAARQQLCRQRRFFPRLISACQIATCHRP